MSTTAPNPTKLTEVRTDMEAAMIVAVLEEHGIDAFLTGEFTSGFRAEAPGNVNVLVGDTDLVKAQQILREFRTQSDSESTNKDEQSGQSFRDICRALVVVGLIATALSMIIRLATLAIGEL
ncbi:putative signal transducing protein [Bythopirellula polymerisocia]|uniref:DUF2007 domain-containing protein n=1 Tax=Bythopirellula polymerisocia TaxID=2528003 RepID=A0A5C6C4V9_9BACT|nr:DUF2007 domain-containing protein [Bythopirellula polymerisocia]TWU17839.1 hypothetical protein Pla144_50460 [Bythopirellula polymerisocia]